MCVLQANGCKALEAEPDLVPWLFNSKFARFDRNRIATPCLSGLENWSIPSQIYWYDISWIRASSQWTETDHIIKINWRQEPSSAWHTPWHTVYPVSSPIAHYFDNSCAQSNQIAKICDMISRIIGFVRACDHCSDFSVRHLSLCNSLFKQEFKYM